MSENIVHIITAEQAREYIQNEKKRRFKENEAKIYRVIKKYIDQSVSRLESHCRLNINCFAMETVNDINIKWIYESIHKQLEGMGYSVCYIDKYPCIEIRWKADE